MQSRSPIEFKPEKVDAVIDNLQSARLEAPTLKTLRSSIKALFVNQVSDEELDALIEQLTQRGTVRSLMGRSTTTSIMSFNFAINLTVARRSARAFAVAGGYRWRWRAMKSNVAPNIATGRPAP